MMRHGGRKGPIITGGGPRAAGESAFGTLLMLGLLAVVAFLATYSVISALHGSHLSKQEEVGISTESLGESQEAEKDAGDSGAKGEGEQKPSAVLDPNCLCRGQEHFELWGEVAVWGTSNLHDSAEHCCKQCSDKCKSADDCTCNAWVFCGDKDACGQNYKQCWLKKQEDVLKPDVHGTSTDVPWTSGIIHAPGMGVIALSTELGNIRIRLEPTWAPQTVSYMRDLLQMKYCTGCQLYRAEGLGEGWNKDGSRTLKAPGPPYALIQGTLQTDGLPFKPIPREAAPVVKRGYVCLVGEGPDFFVSLADHDEWGNAHTVFGRVPEEDLSGVLEKVLALESKKETWGETRVLALASPLSFRITKDSTGIVF